METELFAEKDKHYHSPKYNRYVFGKAGDDCNGAVYLDKVFPIPEKVTITISGGKESDEKE